MKIVDLRNPAPKRITCMVYGFTGAGKTRFAGTWPRPRFLAEDVEGGYDTLRSLPVEELWDPEWKNGFDGRPQVRTIEAISDMMTQVKELKEEVQKSPQTAPQTLVIDSLTFYAD